MRYRGRITGAVVVGVVLALVVLGTWQPGDRDPLASCTVVGMRASLGNSPRRLPDVPPFEVPAAHVPLIRGSWEPAIRDQRPAMWQVLGLVNCACADGSAREVHLYWTGHDAGAFSAGLPNGRTWWSYRGGTDQGIEDAVRSAYAEAARRGEQVSREWP